MAPISPIKPPFPWFGGKSRAIDVVWPRLGNVPNYVEPFFGSGAMLLGRPDFDPDTTPVLETINDKDCYLANFWRAIQAAPDQVAHYADRPVNEADLHAVHYWFTRRDRDDFRERMVTDPRFYDPELAGWWIWGINAWIVNVFATQVFDDPAGRPPRAKPFLAGTGQGIIARSARPAREWFAIIQRRLRHVRVLCGDWTRVLTPSVTLQNGLTGVFLDPPYEGYHYDRMYVESTGISAAVRQWAIENGDNPRLRIALCGYDGEHAMPSGWTRVEWKAVGGHANRSGGVNPNHGGTRERIWFSPHCLNPEEARPLSLFELSA